MSRPEASDTDDETPGHGPGVADLGAFRGRTTQFGAPVLPPGRRPDRDVAPAARTPVDVVAAPVGRPPVPPIGRSAMAPASPAPEATVVSARAVESDVRVVRRIRAWSVWKLSLSFSICMVAVVATAAAVLWGIATGLGVLDNLEGFVEDLGFDRFTFNGGAMLRALVVGGLIAAVAASVMASLLAVMFNLLSDLTGGLETELAPKRTRSRKRRRRREEKRRAAQDAATASGPLPEVPPHRDEPLAVAGVEVAGRNGTTLDLTDDAEVQGAVDEVDRIQRALDELLAEPAPQNDGDGPES